MQLYINVTEHLVITQKNIIILAKLRYLKESFFLSLSNLSVLNEQTSCFGLNNSDGIILLRAHSNVQYIVAVMLPPSAWYFLVWPNFRRGLLERGLGTHDVKGSDFGPLTN